MSETMKETMETLAIAACIPVLIVLGAMILQGIG